MSFEQMWRDLAPVGRTASSGGYHRQPFTAAEREAAAWFVEQCRARDLDVRTDAFGNTVAWWRPGPGGSAEGAAQAAAEGAEPGVVTGSHLDSVRDGGAYDGPLGVVSALAAVDLLRERGFTPTRPLGVSVFVEEEGSRFGLACLGSRLMTGATTLDGVKELRDRDGVYLLDAMAAAGLPVTDQPEAGPGSGSAASSSCTSSRAATWCTGTPRSGWRAGSGRTAGTASTSAARRTTPAPRGWRTGATRW